MTDTGTTVECDSDSPINIDVDGTQTSVYMKYDSLCSDGRFLVDPTLNFLYQIFYIYPFFCLLFQQFCIILYVSGTYQFELRYNNEAYILSEEFTVSCSHYTSMCGAHGTCTSDQCVCDDGYSGTFCDKSNCFGNF